MPETSLSQSAVPFGAAARALFPLDPDLTYLNHGTVGLNPYVILDRQSEIRLQAERNPARFMLRDLKPALRASADRLAGFLGGAGRDYVFVDNATTGVNAVLRSLRFEAGDEILITDLAYGAIAHGVDYIAKRQGVKVVRVEIPFPLPDSGTAVAAVAAKLSNRTRLAVLDHVTSETALILPIRELVAQCHNAGARVLVDGAHVPGMLDLSVPEIDADWYVGNLHKWLFTPRACAILWSNRAREADVDLHPAVVSWGYNQGLTEEFDWTGTRDPTPALCVPTALDFVGRFGAAEIRDYNHQLVRAGALLIASELSHEALPSPAHMTGAMTLAPLPALDDNEIVNKETAQALRDQLLFTHNIEVPVVPWAGRYWLRLAAQMYNDMDDFERLLAALRTSLR